MSSKVSHKKLVDTVSTSNASEPKEGTLIAWKTPEFVTYKRSFWWYFVAALALVLIEGYLLYTKQWFASAAFFAMGAAIYRYSKIQPKEVECKITNSGIYFDSRFYGLSDVRSFWVIEDRIPILNLVSNRRFSVPIGIPLANVDVEKVIQVLGTYIPEQRQKVEELIYKITRLLKL